MELLSVEEASDSTDTESNELLTVGDTISEDDALLGKKVDRVREIVISTVESPSEELADDGATALFTVEEVPGDPADDTADDNAGEK